MGDDAPQVGDELVDVDDRDGGVAGEQFVEERLSFRGQVEAGHVGGGLSVQRARRKDDEEVWLQAVPGHAPGIGDGGAEGQPADVEGQGVPQRQPEGRCVLFLQRHGWSGAGGPPLAVHHHIVGGQVRQEREVALAQDSGPAPAARAVPFVVRFLPALRPLPLPLRCRHAVDPGDAAADHWEHPAVVAGAGLQQGFDRVHLGRRHVHHELVGCALRYACLPFVDQRRAHQQHDQQQHDGHAEDHDLPHVLAVAAVQARQGQAPDATGLHAQGASAAQQDQRQPGEHGDGHGRSGQRPSRQRGVAAVPHQQAQAAAAGAAVGPRRGRCRRQVPADDAHGRNPAQAQERRQAERQHADEAAEKTHPHGPRPRQRQRYWQEAAECRNDAEVGQGAQDQAGQGARRADDQEDENVAPLDLRGRGAQGLQHGHVVVVPACVATGAQGYGDARQQHCQQAAEQQEALRASQGAVDASVGGAHVAPAVAGRQLVADGVVERAQRVVTARQ